MGARQCYKKYLNKLVWTLSRIFSFPSSSTFINHPFHNLVPFHALFPSKIFFCLSHTINLSMSSLTLSLFPALALALSLHLSARTYPYTNLPVSHPHLFISLTTSDHAVSTFYVVRSSSLTISTHTHLRAPLTFSAVLSLFVTFAHAECQKMYTNFPRTLVPAHTQHRSTYLSLSRCSSV